MIVLDGGYGEGGGALVRAALAMSSITVQPVRIEHVRSGQNRAGLNYEDLAILRALAQSTKAETVGAELGSLQVSFLPTHTARPFRGSVPSNSASETQGEGQGDEHANALVVLTTLAPVFARSGGVSEIEAVGETFGRNVLGYDAFEGTTIAAWKRLGLYCEPDLISAGFGLRSKGQVRLDVEPSHLEGAKWTDRGRLVAMRAIVATGGLPDPIGERGASHLNRLSQGVGLPMEAEIVTLDSRSPGAHITVMAEFESGFGSGSATGARGVRIEAVAQQAFERFLDWFRTDSTIDENLADQLLLVALMAEGESIWKVERLTQRFLTMVWVVKQFLPIHLTVKGHEGNPGVVSVRR